MCFPFLSLGGFGLFDNENSNKLNSFFEYGFYSSLNQNDKKEITEKHLKWGFYNGSAGNLDDPRFFFGPGLYWARNQGLSHYLDWHFSSVNNYPYYDFDGRESDVVMFYPSSNGQIYPSLKFEMAKEGLHFFQKLKLIENIVSKSVGARNQLDEAILYLKSLKKESSEFNSDLFYKKNTFDFRKNNNIINSFLDKLVL